VACPEPRVEINGTIEVVDLPHGQTVILTDLYSIRVNPPEQNRSSMRIRANNCAGSIHLQDLSAEYLLEDCRYVTLNRAHGVGLPAVDLNRSRVVVSDCGWLSLSNNSPTLRAVDSKVILFGGSLVSSHPFPGSGESIVLLTDSELIRGGGTTFDLHCQSIIFGQPCPPDFRLLGNSQVRSALEGGILLDEASEGQLGIDVELGRAAKFVVLVASLPAQPVETIIGTFYNDPASSLILNFGDMDQPITIPAFAGNNRLGLPITFQAAMVLQDDSVVLSLSRTSIF